jgi:hypothetical protein
MTRWRQSGAQEHLFDIDVASLVLAARLVTADADDRANRRASRSNRSQPKPCGPGKTTIEMGSAKKLNAHVTSDNKNQLKFRTKQYVGEFFRYTRDLFLIYKSGRLARLTCSPA